MMRVWQVFVGGQPLSRQGLSYRHARRRLARLDISGVHAEVTCDRLDEWEARRQLELFPPHNSAPRTLADA